MMLKKHRMICSFIAVAIICTSLVACSGTGILGKTVNIGGKSVPLGTLCGGIFFILILLSFLNSSGPERENADSSGQPNRTVGQRDYAVDPLDQFDGEPDPFELEQLQSEIQRCKQAKDYDGCVANCRQAIALSEMYQRPEQMAIFQSQLADIFLAGPSHMEVPVIMEAIQLYDQALSLNAPGMMSDWWGIVQNNLGKAYLYLTQYGPRESRETNIEQSIQHFSASLQVRDRNTPMPWANTQIGLGDVFSESGDLDKAIEHYSLALEVCMPGRSPERSYIQAMEVYMPSRSPEMWAGLHFKLAQLQWRKGDMEQTIQYYENALEIYTHDSFPDQWVRIYCALGLAYNDGRKKGDEADNIERAISCFSKALEVISPDDEPTKEPDLYCDLHGNLANAYCRRLEGQKIPNLSLSTKHCQKALDVCDQDALTIALLHINMGNSHETMASALIFERKGTESEISQNIKDALYHYQLALEGLNPKDNPGRWAGLHTNWGLLLSHYSRYIVVEDQDNYALAISHLTEACRVLTRDAQPRQWALMHSNLGSVYLRSGSDQNKPEYLEEALVHYQQASKVWTRDHFLGEYRSLQQSLGDLYSCKAQWKKAFHAYQEAIEAENVLFPMIYTETGRKAEITHTSELFSRAAYCLLKLGRPMPALLQFEAGKTRLLREALQLDQMHLSLLWPDQKSAFQSAYQQVLDLEAEMRSQFDCTAPHSDHALVEQLRTAREDLNTLVEEIRQNNPDLFPANLTSSELLALIPEGGALVAPLITINGSVIFVVPQGVKDISADNIIWLNGFRYADLTNLLRGPSDSCRLEGWLVAYFSFRAQYSQSAYADWQTSVEKFTGQLWDMLMGPIHQKLNTLGVNHGATVLFLPSGGLQLLPLHAAWCDQGGEKKTFIDDYGIAYAPSVRVLTVAKHRLSDQTGKSALVIGINNYRDPEIRNLPPLNLAVAEAWSVGESLETTPLIDDKATKDVVLATVPQKVYLHFSCHGSYNWDAPLKSGIDCYDETLTLQEILHSLKLNAVRLVTLSACETGVTETRLSPDEYIGLPAGFMQAGAPAVVSSLWAVNDYSTALLMIRFYHYLLADNLHPVAALRKAQLWLRDVTKAELIELFDANRNTPGGSHARKTYEQAQENFRKRILLADPDVKPFNHPYYWAGFVFYGV